MFNTKEQIAKAIEQTENALLVYQDENNEYQIAAMCTDTWAVLEMGALVAARLDTAAYHLIDG